MDDRWQTFFEKFPNTVTISEQLPVKLPRFELDLIELAGAAADLCHQYLKDRKCPSDLILFLTKKIINNLRVRWATEPKSFGYRPEKDDYQALWVMQQVIKELNEVCLNHSTVIPYHQPILTPIWWSSFVLKNVRRQMEDYIAVVPYLHTLFDVKDCDEASFYAIYDGHNGLDAAVYSSMYLHQYLVQSEHYPTKPDHALYEAFITTDSYFAEKTEKYNLVSGTTAVCALIRPQEKKLYVAWVGDSIATLWKNGTPLCLVNKHVPERQDETQRIENEGGMISKCQGIWRVDGQLAVSRAIGDVKYKPHITCLPEMRVLVLDGNEEFLVLGSDGLWENITPVDVAETIYDELLETDGDVFQVANKLVFKSKAHGSKDNISVIVVFLQDPKNLLAKRRTVIMETAMEQRNATSTLASYGQDAGDFGPETDVDTPDEPISLTKPKAEGEVNVIDESGEDSEEDGGGWNYYNKSTEDPVVKKTYPVEDDNTGNNSDVEDMDYKLNPDAPEFVPVSSPITNHAQRLLNMDNDDFISSSPQKFKESIDNVDVPDEKEFTNEIKVHAADLSEFSEPHELNNESAMLNGIKPLSEEVTGDHVDTINDSVFQNKHIPNRNSNSYQNPFIPDDKVDLNKVQDLSEYLTNDSQIFNTDPCVSIIETSKTNELNSTSSDNVLQNESDAKLNDNFTIDEHMKYEQDMNSKNINDTANATVDSTLQLDKSFKHSENIKNEFMSTSSIDKLGQFEDGKLNDSVSTTDAVLGSEPNTPMRMDNQSTFESESEDDQFSESFKQQLQFNNLDEHNDKENHDPFYFDQIEDPAGIIPNVSHELNEEINETHHNDDNIKPDNNSNEPELIKHEPVEEPLCVKEEAIPFHSAYEQQYLPESDFSASTHEALLNTTESNLENDVKTEHYIIENFIKNKEENVERQNLYEFVEQEPNVPSHVDDIEQNDSNLDHVKYHSESFKQENDFEESNSIIHSEHIQSEHIKGSEHEYVKDFKQKNFANDIYNIKHLHDNYDEAVKSTEDIKQKHGGIAEVVQNYNIDVYKFNFETNEKQDDGDFQSEYHNNDGDIIPKNTLDLKQENQFYIPGLKEVKNIAETIESHPEEFEQKYYNNLSQQMQNDFVKIETENFQQECHDVVEVKNDFVKIETENFQQECHDVVEVKNNSVEDFKQDYNDVSKDKNIHVQNFKPTHNDVAEIVDGDFQLEQYNVESYQNPTADSDEEMHSSMIIHSDVENNMPQPYCSTHNTLMNKSDMMCTSMTFEENFQNRNMSDSLYVMETSSDYFGDLQQTTQLDQSVDELKVEEQPSNMANDEHIQIKNSIITKEISELISESKIEELKAEVTKSSQLTSQGVDEKIKNREENNKVAEIAAAAVVGTVAVAAIAGASLASKKSVLKKLETTISKDKTTSTKTSSTKPLASKTSAPIKKTTLSTTSKLLSRPMTAPSASKPITNVRPPTVSKTTTLKATTITKVSPKPAPKTTIRGTPSTSAKILITTPRTSMTKTTPVSSPKTPTTPKTRLATKSTTTPKPSIPRTSTLTSKQPLTTNGSPKLVSNRPTSAPAKKLLSSVTTNSTTKLTNGTSKLTNGGIPKTSTTTKTQVTLATRMSLAPPKLPPKVKVAAKTEIPPVMPGPIRRPKALITKKTEAATS